jgi:hypothetical protein
MKKLMAIAALTLVCSGAQALGHHHGVAVNPDGKTLTNAPGTLQAPEIDPGSGVAALTLLIGGLAVVMGTRRSI